MTAAGTDHVAPSIAPMLKTVPNELDRHVDDDGPRAVCGCAFPCGRAELAALALGAF